MRVLLEFLFLFIEEYSKTLINWFGILIDYQQYNQATIIDVKKSVALGAGSLKCFVQGEGIVCTDTSGLDRTEWEDGINDLLVERHSTGGSVCTFHFCFLQTHYKRVRLKKPFENVKAKYKCQVQFMWDLNSLMLQIIFSMFQMVN